MSEECVYNQQYVVIMLFKEADQVGRCDDLCLHAGVSNGYWVAVCKFIMF